MIDSDHKGQKKMIDSDFPVYIYIWSDVVGNHEMCSEYGIES